MDLERLTKRLHNLAITDKDIVYSTGVSKENGKTTVWCRINDNYDFEDKTELERLLKKRQIDFSKIKEITFEYPNIYYDHNDPHDWEYQECRTESYRVSFANPDLEAIFYNKSYGMIFCPPTRSSAPFGSFG